jgi:hypothetical protein
LHTDLARRTACEESKGLFHHLYVSLYYTSFDDRSCVDPHCDADFLVSDDPQLCYAASEYGSLAKLITVAKSITPTPNEKEKTPEWDEEEPEAISLLREVILLFLLRIGRFLRP